MPRAVHIETGTSPQPAKPHTEQPRHKVWPDPAGFAVTHSHLIHYLMHLLGSSYLTVPDIMKGSATKYQKTGSLFHSMFPKFPNHF